MSDLDYYLGLLDDARLGPFLRAIRATVKRGSTFVDIGCGVGTYAIEAKRRGARVIAVDLNRTAVAMAREAGVAAVHGRIERVRLPRADVVLFEDYGPFGYTSGLRSVIGVAKRIGRKFLPSRVELWLAPIEGEQFKLSPGLPFDAAGLAWLRKRALNLPRHRRIQPGRMMARGVRVGEIRLDREPARVVEGVVRAARSGRVTALVGWTRVVLPGGVVDNRPAKKATTWFQLVLPLERPFRVRSGERVRMRVEVTDDWGEELIWRWSAGESEGCSLNARPGDAELLRRGSPDWVPAKRDLIARIVRAVDGSRSVREIAKAARCSVDEALAALGELL